LFGSFIHHHPLDADVDLEAYERTLVQMRERFGTASSKLLA